MISQATDSELRVRDIALGIRCAAILFVLGLFGSCNSVDSKTASPRLTAVERAALARRVATQSFINKCDDTLHAADARAKDMLTVAGRNDEMVAALTVVLSSSVPLDADSTLVGEYLEVSRKAKAWYSVRPNWRMLAAYSAGGGAAAVVDILGGFGVGSVTLTAAVANDIKTRKDARASAQAAIDRWNRLLTESGYSSNFWRNTAVD